MNKIKSIISYLENLVETDMTLEEIIEVSTKIKDIEKKLKTKQKKQKISISKIIYLRAEKLSKNLGVNTIEWIEKSILEQINSAIVKIDDYDSFIEEEKQNLIDRYKSIKQDLVKTDKYVQAKEIEFNGHSVVDGDPIYEIKNKDLIKKLNKVVKMKVADNSEISKTIPSDENKEIIFDDKNIF